MNLLQSTRPLQMLFMQLLIHGRHHTRTASFNGRLISKFIRARFLGWRYLTTCALQNRTLCTNVTGELSCWKCNYIYAANIDRTASKATFFCSSCNIIQEPQENITYFDIMQCEQSFDIDTKYLTEVYRRLQSQLHPDKFSLKSEIEQSCASLQSSIVNEAYHTLFKPFSRGLYLLKVQGSSIEDGNIASNVEFLSNIMEMNETLENGTEEALNTLKQQVEENLVENIQDVSDAFDNKNTDAAKEILSKMKYYENINEQIKEKLVE